MEARQGRGSPPLISDTRVKSTDEALGPWDFSESRKGGGHLMLLPGCPRLLTLSPHPEPSTKSEASVRSEPARERKGSYVHAHSSSTQGEESVLLSQHGAARRGGSSWRSSLGGGRQQRDTGHPGELGHRPSVPLSHRRGAQIAKFKKKNKHDPQKARKSKAPQGIFLTADPSAQNFVPRAEEGRGRARPGGCRFPGHAHPRPLRSLLRFTGLIDSFSI